MQLLKDNTGALRDAIAKTGRVMLFRRAVQFETPSRGLAEYAPGDLLELTDADLASVATCREVARLCAYTPERGIQMARAQLFKSNDSRALKSLRAELLEDAAAADERAQADAEASRGFATIVRGQLPGRDAAEVAAENQMLRGELARQADANDALHDRLAALEAAVGAASPAQRELPDSSPLSDDARQYCAAIQDRIDTDGVTQAQAIDAQRDLMHLPSNRVVAAELKAWRAEQAAATGR